MINLTNVSLNFSGTNLFSNVNLIFSPGNCYGVIGANGAGKSTFLKILSGELECTTGDVSIPSNLRMSVLKQDHYAFNDFTVLDTIIMGNTRLYEIMKQKDELYSKPDFSDEDGLLVAELEGEFAQMNGWDAESDAGKLAQGLGLSLTLMDKTVASCTDAEKVKILLAQALFGHPEILLLDEPTSPPARPPCRRAGRGGGSGEEGGPAAEGASAVLPAHGRAKNSPSWAARPHPQPPNDAKREPPLPTVITANPQALTSMLALTVPLPAEVLVGLNARDTALFEAQLQAAHEVGRGAPFGGDRVGSLPLARAGRRPPLVGIASPLSQGFPEKGRGLGALHRSRPAQALVAHIAAESARVASELEAGPLSEAQHASEAAASQLEAARAEAEAARAER
ncbi:MAG: ATP-binding cassette domain-containing protein, partial [Alphaproteobacteria bacterium]